MTTDTLTTETTTETTVIVKADDLGRILHNARRLRYTRKDAESALQRLAEATGHRVATSYSDIGGWSLDYAPIYGGFVIHEISTAGGGVSTPFGDRRRPAREFCDAVSFALRALESAR